jgi:hypothetical protein
MRRQRACSGRRRVQQLARVQRRARRGTFDFVCAHVSVRVCGRLQARSVDGRG